MNWRAAGQKFADRNGCRVLKPGMVHQGDRVGSRAWRPADIRDRHRAVPQFSRTRRAGGREEGDAKGGPVTESRSHSRCRTATGLATGPGGPQASGAATERYRVRQVHYQQVTSSQAIPAVAVRGIPVKAPGCRRAYWESGSGAPGRVVEQDGPRGWLPEPADRKDRKDRKDRHSSTG